MSLNFVFKKEYVVGLDIGTSSVKLAQFVQKEDGPHLVRARLQEIPQDANDVTRDANLVSAIRDLTKGIDLKKSRVVVTVNCPQTAIKKVSTPYMPKAELRDGVKLIVNNFFQLFAGDTKNSTDLTRHRTEVPDMNYRHRQ